jgi:hypothetical protein
MALTSSKKPLTPLQKKILGPLIDEVKGRVSTAVEGVRAKAAGAIQSKPGLAKTLTVAVGVLAWLGVSKVAKS